MTEYSDVEGSFVNAEHLSELNGISLETMHELIEEATARTRDASLQALINIRTTAALKAGGALNPGKLAQQAIADYDAHPATWRRGKLVLGVLASLLQKELKRNPTILRPSQHLKCAPLTDIATKIWGMPAEVNAP